MGFEDFVSENEAANLAGISVATLKRFSEAGYLKLERDADGLPLFSKRELSSVFGMLKESVSLSPQEQAGLASGFGDFSKVQPPTAPSSEMPHKEAEESASPASSAAISSTIVPFPRSAASATGTSSPHISNAQTPPHSALLVSLEQEVGRLKNILDLQEKLLMIREEEIKGLKEERVWLRQRMERLEDKSERDQLLLLSETQTVKKLITLQEQRKSGFRVALDWLGFTKPAPLGEQIIPHAAHAPTVVSSPSSRTTSENRTANVKQGGTSHTGAAKPKSSKAA